MQRKKATLLTFNYLTVLPKVCRNPNSQSPIKTLTLLRNFSAATERLDFDNPSGTNNEDCRNDDGQGRNSNLKGNNGYILENLDGFNGGNETDNGVYQQNSTGVYEKRPVYGRQQKPVGENGIFPSNNDNSNSFHSFREGFQRNPDGRNGNLMSRNEFQLSSGAIRWRRDGENGNFTNGYPRKSPGYDFDQSSVGQNLNFSNWGSVGAQQNLNGSYRLNPVSQMSGFGDGYGGASQRSAMRHNVDNLGSSQESSQNYAGRHGYLQDNSNGGVAEMNQQTSSVELKGNDESTSNDGCMNLTCTIEELDDFVKEGKLDEALKVLGMLEEQGIAVDLPRYLVLMSVCGKDGGVEEAKFIHRHLMRSVPNLEFSTYNKILEMYSECGSMVDAYSVFEKMPQRNLTSWDTLISGFAKNGHGETAIEMFTEFKGLGLEPDGQMYIGVFKACAALLDTKEGMLHFEAMRKDYSIVPFMEHYVSVVDMLGSTGHLDEALEFIEKMPMQPSVEVWETLMHLSRVQGNMELGDRCAEVVDLLDPTRLDEQSRAGFIPVKASSLSQEKEKKKSDSQNPLEVRSRVHEYRAGDRSDPDHEKLYALLWGLKQQMKEVGYIPETRVVLHDIDQESKEEAVLGHSERLAVAKGFLNTPARTRTRVIKNLRVCVDCHNAMKIISKLVGRELIMRDAKRFHHFNDGVCSCRDYW